MGLKRYDLTIPRRGGDVTTTVKLSDADAERLGLKKPAASKAAAKPANKARTASNKAVKPAAAKSSVEAASDPDASEA